MIKHIIEPDGTERWFKNNKWHSQDGPAIIWPNGSENWCNNGKDHRINAPAMIFCSGSEFYLENNKLWTCYDSFWWN